MSYPNSLDTFTNPLGSQTLNSPSHSGIETAQNTALSALETKVGVDSSAITTTLDYLLKSTSSSNPGHKHTFSSLSDFTVSGSVAGDIIQYNGTKYVNIPATSIPLKFGGTGADGALNISSGTTTIDCANADIIVKNYSSISITGTGKLAFSNPGTNGTAVFIKSQGAITLTSSQTPMIEMTGMGAVAGASATSAVGNAGTVGKIYSFIQTVAGVGGQAFNSAAAGGGSLATATLSLNVSAFLTNMVEDKYFLNFVGAGGASGGSQGGAGASGAGGRGGGSLTIECGGAWNFTTTNGIYAMGSAGANSSNANTGGGGGGGGGYLGVFYNTLTANSGTISVAGGTGGTGNGGSTGTAGANGFSLIVKNSEYA